MKQFILIIDANLPHLRLGILSLNAIIAIYPLPSWVLIFCIMSVYEAFSPLTKT